MGDETDGGPSLHWLEQMAAVPSSTIVSRYGDRDHPRQFKVSIEEVTNDG